MEQLDGMRRRLVVCLAVSVGGCASPFVAVDSGPMQSGANGVTLEEATQFSISRQTAYKAKIQELAQKRKNYAYSVYGLGVTLIGMGAAKVHPSALAGTAIGGAAIYGLGLMDTNSLHAKIYEEGIKQLNCANAVVAPMHAQAIKDLGQLANDLQAKEALTASALGDLYKVPGASTGTDASRIIDSARTALTNASTALSSADSVATTSAISGNMLRNTVLAIDAAVIKDIDDSTIKVSEVPSMIARISENTKLFSTYSAAGATFHPSSNQISRPGVAADARAEADKAAALGRLQSEVVRLVAATNRVTAKAGEIKAAVAGAGSLADCKYQVQIASLAVSPATLVFDEGDTDATSRRLTITGGRSQNYSFTVLGSDAAIFKFNNPLVSPTKALPAKPSSYQAEVRDGLEAQIVTINITPKPAAAGNAGGSGDGTVSLDFMKALAPVTLDNGAKIQIVDAKKRSDGKYEVTYKKISGDAVTNEEVAQKVAAITEVKTQLGENPPIVAVASTEGPHSGRLTRPGYGQAVRRLTRIEIDQAQRKLGMRCEDVDGLWEGRTQRAFEGNRTPHQATGDEVQALLRQPDITTLKACPEKPYAKKQ